VRYYIIAGEASGDMHASNLIKELKKLDKESTIRAWGGDMMQNQGAVIVKHYRDLAFMGFAEVLMNLPVILRNISFCKNDLLDFAPDVLILVDYPGFNLRIAEFAKSHDIKVIYYISPQIWAWKKGRIHTIKRVVDKMLVILPFEKEFYKQFNVEVEFVGHPLLDAIVSEPVDSAGFYELHKLPDRQIISLLPGSRKQEILKMLDIMLGMVDLFPDYQFVIGGAPSIDRSFYSNIIGNRNVKVISGATHQLLRHSKAALITSGTATLEAGLLRVPEVVCYKGNPVSFAIAKRLVHLKYISLVNLIMDRPVVTELIQNDLNSKNLQFELSQLLTNDIKSTKLLADYNELIEKLGGPGASAKAAKIIQNFLNQ
jgi:lipid-A-disaccharide synthase